MLQWLDKTPFPLYDDRFSWTRFLEVEEQKLLITYPSENVQFSVLLDKTINSNIMEIGLVVMEKLHVEYELTVAIVANSNWRWSFWAVSKEISPKSYLS